MVKRRVGYMVTTTGDGNWGGTAGLTKARAKRFASEGKALNEKVNIVKAERKGGKIVKSKVSTNSIVTKKSIMEAKRRILSRHRRTQKKGL